MGQHDPRTLVLNSGCTFESSRCLKKPWRSDLKPFQSWHERQEFPSWWQPVAKVGGCCSEMQGILLCRCSCQSLPMAQVSDGDGLAPRCTHLDFSLLRTPVHLLLEQSLDASNLGRLMGHIFSQSWTCLSFDWRDWGGSLVDGEGKCFGWVWEEERRPSNLQG